MDNQNPQDHSEYQDPRLSSHDLEELQSPNHSSQYRMAHDDLTATREDFGAYHLAHAASQIVASIPTLAENESQDSNTTSAPRFGSEGAHFQPSINNYSNFAHPMNPGSVQPSPNDFLDIPGARSFGTIDLGMFQSQPDDFLPHYRQILNDPEIFNGISPSQLQRPSNYRLYTKHEGVSMQGYCGQTRDISGSAGHNFNSSDGFDQNPLNTYQGSWKEESPEVSGLGGIPTARRGSSGVEAVGGPGTSPQDFNRHTLHARSQSEVVLHRQSTQGFADTYGVLIGIDEDEYENGVEEEDEDEREDSNGAGNRAAEVAAPAGPGKGVLAQVPTYKMPPPTNISAIHQIPSFSSVQDFEDHLARERKGLNDLSIQKANDDGAFPVDSAGQRAAVKQIIDALYNFDGFIDKPGKGQQVSQSVGRFRTSFFRVEDLERSAWKVLIRTRDAQLERLVDKSFGFRYETDHKTWRDRFNALLEGIKGSKAMAKMVCDCEYLDRLADAPKAELRMKINNKKINTQRDIDNATGRLAKKAGYDASSLLRLAERRESSGPSTPDKTSAPAPAPPTGSKKRKPSSTRVFDKDEDGDSDFSRGRKSSTSKKLRPTAKKNSGLGRPPKASKTRAQSMSELPPRMMSASIRAASRPGSSVVCPPVPQFPPHMAPGSGPVHPPCNSPAHQSFGGYFSPGSPHTTYMSPNCALGSGSPGMFLAASQFNNHFPLPDFGQQPPQSQNSQRLPGGVSSHDAA